MNSLFKILFIIFVIGICFIAILVPIYYTQEKKEKYNLLIMGNQGQFEYFKRTYSEVISLDSLKQEKIDRIFKDTTYDVTNGACKINTPGKVLDLTNLDNAESRNEGMKNFYEIISTDNFKTNLNKADGVVFLGNSIIPEAELLAEIDANKKTATLGSQEKWNQRLTCGWNVFNTHLQKIGLLNNGKLKDQVTLIVGNNGYDVSYKVENEILKPMENSYKISTFWTYDQEKQKAVIATDPDPTAYEWVKKTTIHQKDRTITFLDIDTNYLLCVGLVQNATGYSDPNKCKLTDYFIDGKGSYEDVMKYYLSIYSLVSDMDPNHWNVIRGHHPPTNYKDGDTSIFWDVNIHGKVYNLMEKFQENNVRIYLAANINAQSVMAIPFFGKYKIRDRENLIGNYPDGQYCNPSNLRELSHEILITSIFCPFDNFDVDLNKENMMLVFINGNSGRNLDPIFDGKRSERGNLVWTKKTKITSDAVTKDAFGFSNIEFEKDKLTFQFYDSSFSFLNNKMDTTLASTFNVKFKNE
jgi:hypothetical protein